MSTVAINHKAAVALHGAMLWVGAIVLAMANFLAVLNMTIANVTQPNMAGALGASTSQGTWIITAYAVAEAITVPMTGWLTARFGGVKVFAFAVFMFGVSSLMCGMSTSLGMLVVPETASVGQAHQAFDEHGALKEARQQQSVERVVKAVLRTAAALG